MLGDNSRDSTTNPTFLILSNNKPFILYSYGEGRSYARKLHPVGQANLSQGFFSHACTSKSPWNF